MAIGHAFRQARNYQKATIKSWCVCGEWEHESSLREIYSHSQRGQERALDEIYFKFLQHAGVFKDNEEFTTEPPVPAPTLTPRQTFRERRRLEPEPEPTPAPEPTPPERPGRRIVRYDKE